MKGDLMQDTIDALDDLLDAERSALLQGDLEEVTRLHLRKERLIDELSRQHVQEETEFAVLQAKVERNQALLDSALDGVRSVARRLASIRRVRQSLDTYDSLGKKRSVDLRKGGTLEKRA
jgi:ligand-binding sensor domain-containing protein